MPLYQVKCKVRADEGDYLFIEDNTVKAVLPGREIDRVSANVTKDAKPRKQRVKYEPGTVAARRRNVLEVLKSGPATSREILDVLEIPESDKEMYSRIHDDLHNMERQGIIKSKRVNDSPMKLYSFEREMA